MECVNEYSDPMFDFDREEAAHAQLVYQVKRIRDLEEALRDCMNWLSEYPENDYGFRPTGVERIIVDAGKVLDG
jgi:hypothetical protein